MPAALLDQLSLPSALKQLVTTELEALAAEIRRELIETVSATGGHLAPSLGVVELTLALHRQFDTPQDRIVWDVGHQAYVHKLLTGRRHRLPTIRSSAGIAGYLKRNESEYDAFGAGHAGTAISAALGMRLATRTAVSAGGDREKSASLRREDYVVAVVGDGALTAGMSFEALNHAGSYAGAELDRFIVVLNDNGMSISKNVGALSNCTDPLREAGGPARSARHPRDLFTTLGFHYLGPIDGHDLAALESGLAEARARRGPVFVHVLTVKGKGLAAAEADPVKWHGIAPLPAPAAEPSSAAARTLSAHFAEALLEIAATDSRVVAITAAMPTGTGLDRLQRELPHAVIDVGICEQHAVTLAAGLACEGMRPVVAIYSTFLQRGFDQLLHDVCIQNLPVVFVLDRAGLVGNDGETHQGVFDIAMLRAVPNMTIMVPRDELQLARMLRTAVAHDGPTAIRFPRANGLAAACSAAPRTALPLGYAEQLEGGDDGLIIGVGPLAYRARALAEWIRERSGDRIEVFDPQFVKPLDPRLVARVAVAPWTLVLEDHSRAGGAGSAVLEAVYDAGLIPRGPIHRAGVPDRFIAHGTIDEQHRWCGLDESSLKRWYEELRAAAVPARESRPATIQLMPIDIPSTPEAAHATDERQPSPQRSLARAA